MWLVVGFKEEDLEGTKLACYSKDTSWAYCSWYKPVRELVKESKPWSREELASEVSLEALFTRDCCLRKLGWPSVL